MVIYTITAFRISMPSFTIFYEDLKCLFIFRTTGSKRDWSIILERTPFLIIRFSTHIMY